jgi:RHS repeat-associated protein
MQPTRTHRFLAILLCCALLLNAFLLALPRPAIAAPLPQETTAQPVALTADCYAETGNVFLPTISGRQGGDPGAFGFGATGPQHAPLGGIFRLNLPVNNPTNAPLTFAVAPLPLPANTTFDPTSGRFTFAPTADQVGDYSFTFTVSNGAQQASTVVPVTVPAPDPNAVTTLCGRILDANAANGGRIKPLVGATVRLMTSPIVNATTDERGYFLMAGIPAGEHYFEYDGSTATPAGTYGAYRGQKVIVANVTNIVDRPLYIMAIDKAGETAVKPNARTVVNNPNINVTVSIPANTVVDDNGQLYGGPISVSPVPEQFTPAALPDTLDPSRVLTIQPMGLTFRNPAPIRFPNSDNLEPNSEVDIWSLDHELGRFFIAGRGRVSADRKWVDTIEGGIRESSWHFPLPPSMNSDGPKDGPQDNKPSCKQQCCPGVASELRPSDGCVETSVLLPGYSSIGETRQLEFSYISQRAYPVPILPFEATLSARAAIPTAMQYQLRSFGGISSGLAAPTIWNKSGLSESKNEPLRGSVVVNGAHLATGVYPYSIRLTNQYGAASVSSDVNGRYLLVNEQNSPFGTGWGLAGVSRLYESYNGRLMLADGDGATQLFGPQPLDLRTWQQEGVLANGQWTVAADGQSVLQGINKDPTFFVSPENFINTTIRGTFRVEDPGADVPGDFIGFVLGYQSPLRGQNDNSNNFDFLLFSWKEGDQTDQGYLGAEGFSLSRVKGVINNYPPNFWGQTESPEFDVLATNFGTDKGWARNIDHDFELNYTDTRIQIFIDGQQIFDLAGNFQAGRFGFYNYSQEKVRYKNFTFATDIERFAGPSGDFSVISKAPDNTYTRRLKDGTEYHFNAAGLQTAMIDRNGNRTAYAYDDQGRLTTITDPANLATTFAYNGPRLQSVTDPMGRVTSFEHNGAGDLVKVTFPDGSSKGFGYDERHLMTSETDERNFVTTRTYDAYGRLVSAVVPGDITRATSYAQKVGLVTDPTVGTATNPAPIVRPAEVKTTITDGENRTTTYTFGPLQSIATTVDPAGLTTVIERDRDSNPTKTTYPSGQVINQSFDSRGNPLTVNDPTVNGTTSIGYEALFNQPVTIKDPFNNVTNLTYDSKGNPIRIASPLNRTVRMAYNGVGLPTVMTDTLGTVAAFGYYGQGNLTNLNWGGTRSAAFAYTPHGYLQTMTDPLGRGFAYQYDAHGRLLQETLPGARTVRYGYDAAGNLTSLTPPDRPEHRFEYDGLGQLTAYIPPSVDGVSNPRTSYEYNKAQQLTKLTRPDNLAITYGYDSAGRLQSTQFSRGALGYSYHATSGQLVGITAPENVTLGFQYKGDLLTGESWSGALTGNVQRTYDAGYRTASIRVNNAPINYQYDADNAPLRAGALTLAYQPTSGLLANTTLGSVNDSFGYNTFGELQSYRANVGAAPLFQTGYARDSLGRITTLKETVEGTTNLYLYSYDAAGRLMTVIRNGAQIASYSYDANGNRTNTSDSRGTFAGSYDNQDRLLSYGSTTYSYSANGELQSKTVASTGSATAYSYDEFGNLTRVTLPTGEVITYLIDGKDRRIGKGVNGVLQKGWLYEDQLRPVAELDGSGAVVSRFVYATRVNVPDYLVKGGVTYRLVLDHLGSVRLVVNTQNGQVAQRLDYDAWGLVTQDTNPGFQPFGFAGGLYDAQTGLVRFGARDYDPVVGRWTSKDPIGFEGGDGNLYAYVINDPVNLSDVEGKAIPFAVWAAYYYAYIGLQACIRNPICVGVAGSAIWDAIKTLWNWLTDPDNAPSSCPTNDNPTDGLPDIPSVPKYPVPAPSEPPVIIDYA